MNQEQIKILQEVIRNIPSISICGKKFALNWESEAIVSTGLLSIHKRPHSLEAAKLLFASLYEWETLEEGDEWSAPLLRIEGNLRKDVIKKYSKATAPPVIFEKFIELPEYCEASIVQIVLDCRCVTGQEDRWSIVLQIFI